MDKNSSLLAVERAQIVALPMERLSCLRQQIADSKKTTMKQEFCPPRNKKFEKHKIYDDMKKNGKPRKKFTKR